MKLADGALLVSCVWWAACTPRARQDVQDAGPAGATIQSAAGGASTGDAAAARPGMAWIPAGTLRAGTPPDRTPRVADEELAGIGVEMGGFYIDLYPWPNEPGAIPTSNVTRDQAEALCTSKGKRLCTELEWERACKGPDNTTYEYGDAYRSATCGTGVAPDHAARRPAGENAQCKSAFGVSDMHGIVFEWTASSWGRGAKDPSLGVLRGGNATAGELVGRCANGIARAPGKKSPTMGLRCCAGPKNDAEVRLKLERTPGLSGAPGDVARAWQDELVTVVGAPVEPKTLRAWAWSPVANDPLVVVQGCGTGSPRSCGLVIGATRDDKKWVRASAVVGRDPADVARAGDARHLRFRALDVRGLFSREITYVYGRVELGDLKRP